MDTETPESTRPQQPSAEADNASQPDAGLAFPAEQQALDAEALVTRMIEGGEWPEPELIERIVDAGAAAVRPLVAILRAKPRDWPAKAPLSHAIGLLSILRPPEAISELIEIIKKCHMGNEAPV